MVCVIKDIPVYYEEYGGGKPILFIHGWSVDHRMMSGCFEPVFEPCEKSCEGYRRIYVDLPGMGKTPAADWIRYADEMLEILTCFIDALIQDEHFLVAGESFGGHLTLGLLHTLKDRIDGAFLLCPVVDIWHETENLPQKTILWKSEGLGLPEENPELKSFLEMAVIAVPEIFEKYKRDILSGIAISDKRFLLNHFEGIFSSEFRKELSALRYDKPACILTGRQDHAVGYADAYELLEHFPRASFAVLDCAGHNLQIDNEPLFNQFVKDWLWRVELSRT